MHQTASYNKEELITEWPFVLCLSIILLMFFVVLVWNAGFLNSLLYASPLLIGLYLGWKHSGYSGALAVVTAIPYLAAVTFLVYGIHIGIYLSHNLQLPFKSFEQNEFQRIYELLFSWSMGTSIVFVPLVWLILVGAKPEMWILRQLASRGLVLMVGYLLIPCVELIIPGFVCWWMD
jgi:hypothetical protein